MKRRIIALALILSTVVGLTACSSDDDPAGGDTSIPREDIELTQVESLAVKSQIDFAFNLFKIMCAEDMANSNVVVSPVNVAQGLSMLANGASGEALRELTAVLGVAPDDLDALNILNAKLCDRLPSLDNRVNLKFANSAWISPGYSYNTSFTKNINEFYKAESQRADLMSNAGIAQLNAWIENRTDGMIKNIMNNNSLRSHFALVNVLCFNGKWKTSFDVNDTKKGKFHLEDGSEQIVWMMENESAYALTLYDDFVQITLPYGNEAFRMTVFMPRGNKKLSELISSFNAQKYRESITQTEYIKPVKLRMPRFSLNFSGDIFEAVKAMGLNYTLSDDCVDLDKVISNNANVSISNILSGCSVEVDESGTKAAASTIIGGNPIAPGSFSLTIDRPFMFVIDEASTGAIMFMGAVKTL